MLMPSSRFHSQTVLTLMDRVKQAEPATGALICEVAGSRLATVLLEEGRICWAVASGMRRRLTDLLLESSDHTLGRKELESIYRECKGKNVPIGEELVRRGIVPPQGLRDALAEHTSEALVRLGAKAEVNFDWIAHRAPGYSPTYTFGTLDIAMRVAKKVLPEESERGQRLLAESGLPGVAFHCEDPAMAFPVAANPMSMELDGFIGQGRRFHELRQRIDSLGDGFSIAFWRSGDGSQFAVSAHGDLTIAHFLTRPTDLALLFKARMKT